MDSAPGSLDEVTGRLAQLRARAGSPSYAELARRVARLRRNRGVPDGEAMPGRVTVYDCFRTGRRRLDGQLVADLAAVLGDDPSWWLEATAAASGRAPASIARADLPDPEPIFVGREAQLRALTDPGSRVCVITGMAGVGKTQLALRAAGALSAADAQLSALFIDLHGFDAEAAPDSPVSVLRALLRAMGRGSGVAAMGQQECVHRLRQLTAERPVVLVLDNAAGVEQLLPMLPLPEPSRTIITSRRVLDVPGARTVELAPLSPAEAVDLIAGHVGGGRVRDEPAAAADLAQLSGHLPLCVAVTAAHVAQQSDWTLADHAQRLRQLPEREATDRALDVSYRQLEAGARELLCLLTLPGSVGLGPGAADALLGRPAAAAVARLGAEHLVRVTDDGIVMHDLVRDFARVRLLREVPLSRQRGAMRRLARYLCDRAAAHNSGTGWIDDEGRPAPSVVDWLAEHHEPDAAAALAAVVGDHLRWAGYLRQARQVQAAALRATDPGLRATAHLNLGAALADAGQFSDAEHHLAAALEHAVATGDLAAEYRCYNQLGNVRKRSGQYREAVDCYERARVLAERRGDPEAVAPVLANLGDLWRLVGRYEASAQATLQALAIYGPKGQRRHESGLHGNLVLLHVRTGDLARARVHLDAARRIDAGAGSRNAHTLHAAAELHLTLGDWSAAATEFGEALDLCRDSGDHALEGTCLWGQGAASLGRGELDAAERSFAAASRLAATIDDREVALMSLLGLADVASSRGQETAAGELAAEARRRAESLGDPFLLAHANAQPPHAG